MQILTLLIATATLARAAPFDFKWVPIHDGHTEFRSELVYDSTDQACAGLVPPAISERASLYGDNGFTYYCRSSTEGATGPFAMFCPRDDSEYWYRRRLYTVPVNVLKGECVQHSRTEYGHSPAGSVSAHRDAPATRHGTAPIPGQGSPNTAPAHDSINDLASTEVSAGSPACVESPAMHSENQALEAYLTSIDDTKRATAAYISLYEVHPHSQDMGTEYNVNHLNIAQPALGATYRACAKAPPGHGNLRLHLISSS